LNRLAAPPRDTTGAAIARAIQRPGALRERHTSGIHVSRDATTALGRLEHAFRLCHEAEPIAHKVRRADPTGLSRRLPLEELADRALASGTISAEEAALLHAAEVAREDAIQVDSFTLDEYRRGAAHAADSAIGDSRLSG
jgi:acyl-CoA dehydrogenase